MNHVDRQWRSTAAACVVALPRLGHFCGLATPRATLARHTLDLLPCLTQAWPTFICCSTDSCLVQASRIPGSGRAGGAAAWNWCPLPHHLITQRARPSAVTSHRSKSAISEMSSGGGHSALDPDALALLYVQQWLHEHGHTEGKQGTWAGLGGRARRGAMHACAWHSAVLAWLAHSD